MKNQKEILKVGYGVLNTDADQGTMDDYNDPYR